MNLGRRIIYDSQTGIIILDTGEQINATSERPIWNGVTYIDIPYGQDADKYNKVIKYHVDITTKIVIFDQLQITQDERINAVVQSLFNLNIQFNSDNKKAELLNELLNVLKNLQLEA